VYDGRDGSRRSLADVVRAAVAAPSGGGAGAGSGGTVVLIGEAHDDRVAHAFERRLLREVWAAVAAGPARRTSLCLEMFERDVQGVLDEVLTLGVGQGGGGGGGGGAGRAGARSSAAVAGAAEAAGGSGSALAPGSSGGGGDGNDDTEVGDARLQPPLLQRLPPPAANANASPAASSAHTQPPPRSAPPSLLFREDDLLRDARPWPNYAADYRPLVMDAVARGARVVAANAPRRYVSVAGRHGAAALEAALPPGCRAREWLAPLPHVPASRAYAQRIEASMRAAAEAMRAGRQQQEPAEAAAAEAEAGAAAAATAAAAAAGQVGSIQANSSSSSSGAEAAKEGGKEGGCPYTGFSVSSNFLAAQNAWDATMAWTVAQELLPLAAAPSHGSQPAAPPASLPPLVALVAGRFHIDYGLGVPEHLARYCSATAGGDAGGGGGTGTRPPPPRVVSVTVVQSGSVSMTPEQLGREGCLGMADFLVLSDGRAPPSFRSVHL